MVPPVAILAVALAAATAAAAAAPADLPGLPPPEPSDNVNCTMLLACVNGPHTVTSSADITCSLTGPLGGAGVCLVVVLDTSPNVAVNVLACPKVDGFGTCAPVNVNAPSGSYRVLCIAAGVTTVTCNIAHN